jgi:hypothetical protein
MASLYGGRSLAGSTSRKTRGSNSPSEKSTQEPRALIGNVGYDMVVEMLSNKNDLKEREKDFKYDL